MTTVKIHNYLLSVWGRPSCSYYLGIVALMELHKRQPCRRLYNNALNNSARPTEFLLSAVDQNCSQYFLELSSMFPIEVTTTPFMEPD